MRAALLLRPLSMTERAYDYSVLDVAFATHPYQRITAWVEARLQAQDASDSGCFVVRHLCAVFADDVYVCVQQRYSSPIRYIK